jgi:hypothetical protein
MHPRSRPAEWYPWRPTVGAELPEWLVELALTVECPPLGAGASWPQALLLGRGRDTAFGYVAAACREVEELAGVRAAGRIRLGVAPALAGLDPLASPAVDRHLDRAGRRGLMSPRPGRWEDHGPAIWEAGHGAVLTGWGQAGRSVQAVVVLGGRGDRRMLAPRPGGAVVVRAWKAGRIWGVVIALVLGSDGARELGRDAARIARKARTGGWEARVARGDEAVAIARAGDPRQLIPAESGWRISADDLAALVAVCSTIGITPPWIRPSAEAPWRTSASRRPLRHAQQPMDDARRRLGDAPPSSGEAPPSSGDVRLPSGNALPAGASVRRTRLAEFLTEPGEPILPLPVPPPHRRSPDHRQSRPYL